MTTYRPTDATRTSPADPAQLSRTGGRGPAPEALADVFGVPEPAQIHTGLPQAQGDVLVLPWPPQLAPLARNQALCAARPVPPAGHVALRRGGGHAHVVLADGPDVRLAPDSIGTGLGVLVVGAGSVAVLAHEEHADLHIGPGVYLLRRQRRFVPEEPESLTAYVAD